MGGAWATVHTVNRHPRAVHQAKSRFGANRAIDLASGGRKSPGALYVGCVERFRADTPAVDVNREIDVQSFSRVADRNRAPRFRAAPLGLGVLRCVQYPGRLPGLS